MTGGGGWVAAWNGCEAEDEEGEVSVGATFGTMINDVTLCSSPWYNIIINMDNVGLIRFGNSFARFPHGMMR